MVSPRRSPVLCPPVQGVELVGCGVGRSNAQHFETAKLGMFFQLLRRGETAHQGHNLAPLTKPFAVGFDGGFELEETAGFLPCQGKCAGARRCSSALP